MGKTRDTGFLNNCVFTDSSNNVGIGAAANASYKLQVTGATNLTGALSGTSASFNSNQALTIVGTNSTSANNTITGYSADLYAVAVRQRGASAGISGANFMAQIISATGAEGLEIYTPNSKELILGTNSTARLTIGTTGAATFSSSLGVNGATSTFGILEVVRASGSIAQFSIGWNSSNHTDFFVDNSGNFYLQPQGTTRLTIASTGAATFTTANLGHSLTIQNTNSGYYSTSDYLDNAGSEKLIVGYANSGAGALASKAIIYGTSGVGLNFYTNGSTTAKMVIDTSGNVGIGDTSPQSGLYIAKYGSNWDGDVQYNKPTGNIFLSMGYSVSNQDNWFGIRGNYGSSSGTANILLQANYRDVGSQAGHYIASKATALGIADFEIGKLVTSTSTSTPPTKVPQIYLTTGGNVLIGSTTDNGTRLQVNGNISVAPGSTPSGRTSAGIFMPIIVNGTTYYLLLHN
jgi:hypothetical protein